jgi:hypothetical protein
MADPTFDVAAAHRWFAIEANNGAWDLVEKSSRTPAETERMLHLAHASCWHWGQIGQPINELRGWTLLTTAYVAAGWSSEAIRFGEESLKRLTEVTDATPFDRACIHGSLAAAYQLAGWTADSTREFNAADALAASLEDADDRAVFEKLYPRP